MKVDHEEKWGSITGQRDLGLLNRGCSCHYIHYAKGTTINDLERVPWRKN